MFEIIPGWHPIFVHIAVAVLTFSVFAHQVVLVLSEGRFQMELEVAARWSLWFGAVFAVFTGISGWYAYNTVGHEAPADPALIQHRNLELLEAVLFSILAFWSAWRLRRRHKPAKPVVNVIFLVAVTISGALLAITARHGSELVHHQEITRHAIDASP